MNQDLLNEHQRLVDRGVIVSAGALAALGPNGLALMSGAITAAKAAAIQLQAKTGQKSTAAEIRDAALALAAQRQSNI